MHIIKHGDQNFYLETDERLAEITYRLDENNTFIIEHTTVSEKLKGQGVGALLVEKMVHHARTQRKKLGAECEYAAHILAKNPQYHDVYVASD